MELVSVKVLVIGGVAAGTKAAAKLKREDRGLDVALITKDQDISYAGCGLPYYVGGMIESRDELIVNTPEKYAALTGVRVLTGREAVELDSGKKLEISGHTDDVGSERYNQGLSERRAAAVKAQLVQFGVPAERIVTKGFGKSQPRRTYSPTADEGTRDEARKENRRAEMYLDF